MADISVTAASVVASSTAVTDKGHLFGATVTAGQVVYLDPADNRYKLMDSNASVAGNNTGDQRGIALCGGANGQPAHVCLEDTDFTPGATLSNGSSYYASPNAGAIAPAADITSGNYPTILMIAKSTTKAVLKPVAGGVAV